MIQLNKCYNEDCRNTMAKIDDNSIHLILTSPPYDDLRKYNGYRFDFDLDFKPIAKDCYRILIDGGVMVWVVGDQTIKGSETLTSFKQALYFKEVCGFKVHDTMIWEKSNPIPKNHKRYNDCFEYMFILVKGKISTFNPILIGCKTPGRRELVKKHQGEEKKVFSKNQVIIHKNKKSHYNIFEYYIGGKQGINHPAPFPEKLARDHIFTWSNPGDIVYDPFMGSGTTAKMCILMNRQWIGSEISKKYCDIIEKRIQGYEYHPELEF